MPPCYSFPLLDKKDICKYISECGGPKLSVENLNSPSSEIIGPVYDHLVSFTAFCGLREESLQLPFVAIQMLGDNAELHDDSVGILKSFRRLMKFMTAAGAKDFSITTDLHRPESQRTVKFLSAAINFSMYSNQQMAFILKLNAERDAEFAKIDELSEERANIQNEIQQIEDERLAQQPQVQALELETGELNNRVSALNKQQSGLQAANNKLKQENNSILDKIASLDFEIVQKHQEGARLRALIVDNPQALQRTLEEKKHALAEEEMLLKNALESNQVWKAKAEIIAKAEKKLLKHQRMLQSLEEQLNDRNTDKLLKERKARLKALEKEEWSFQAERVELNLKVQRLEEQVEKVEQQHSAAMKDLEAMKVKQEQCKAEHGPRNRAVAEQEKQAEALQRTRKELIVRNEDKCGQFEEGTRRLMDAGLKFPGIL